MNNSYQQVINDARKLLIENNIYDGFAFRYMLELCQLYDINLYVNKDNQISFDIYNIYQQGIERLLKNEPLAYILGFEWFYGRRFKVNSDVLIPRQETEELLGKILSLADDYFIDGGLVADIATGSGNLAISLALELNNCRVYGLDISESALIVAKQNAIDLGANVNFLCGDMAKPLIDNNIKVDILVANPPYIGNDEKISESVYNYEPHLALFGGNDGLNLYRKLFDQLPFVLNSKSVVGLEIGYWQKDAIMHEINSRFKDCRCWCEKDINGLDRMLFICFGC